MEWGAGRYELIAEQLLPAAEVVVELAAPQEGARVTGVDPAQRLLDVGAATAAERRLDVTFALGEAADIPLEDDGTDVALSVFGVIFAPDPAAAAAEIDRVTTPDGRVLLAAWIPGGAVSQAVRLARETVAEVLDQPPPTPPFPWHERGSLSELFEPHGFSVSLTEHSLAFGAPSIDEFMRIEGENHPLAIAARPVLEGAGRATEVREGMRRIYEEGNEDPDGFRVTSQYVVAELRR